MSLVKVCKGNGVIPGTQEGAVPACLVETLRVSANINQLQAGT